MDGHYSYEVGYQPSGPLESPEKYLKLDHKEDESYFVLDKGTNEISRHVVSWKDLDNDHNLISEIDQVKLVMRKVNPDGSNGEVLLEGFVDAEVIWKDFSPLGTPENPLPSNNSTNVPKDYKLYWDCEGAANYDVYFGKSSNPSFVENTYHKFYNPGELEPNTTYYWKIVSKKYEDSQPSPVWKFTTGNNYGNGDKNALIEAFGGVWCPYCVEGDPYANQLYDDREDVLLLHYHIGDVLEIDENIERKNYYGIGGYPTYMVGGIYKKRGSGGDVYSILSTYSDCAIEILSGDIDIEMEYNDGTLDYEITTQVDYGEVTIYAVLFEDNVQIPGEDLQRNVVRAIEIEEVEDLPKNYSGTVDFTISDDWNKDNLNQLVFISKKGNKLILAAEELLNGVNPPIISKESGPIGTINESSSTFTWSGSDSDGEIIEYEYRKDSGNWYSNGLSNSYTWEGYSIGAHTFEIRAKDDSGTYSNTISWSFNYLPGVTNGKFKVANSWGVGGWENVPDGFLYITYDAMIENNVHCFILTPSLGYEPHCIAVFKIDHDVRNDCAIKVGVGDPDNPSKEKAFTGDTYHDGGKHPFPNNKMVLDITEFLPINDDVYLKVYDGSDSDTGTIEYFAVEYYDSYNLSNPDIIYTAKGLPANTTNNNTTIVNIDDVSLSEAYQISSEKLYKYITRTLTDEDFEIVETNNTSEKYNSHATGLLPLTEEDIEWLKDNALTITGFKKLETLPNSLDNSDTIYFPPIGEQDGVGSCVAFSLGYYINTYYQARKNNWDLSGASWEGGYYGEPTNSYQDKIMSPNFVYNQINNGIDSGSSYVDAIKLISNIGECSWEKFPYQTNPKDGTLDYCTEWPDEEAWREAPKYRSSMQSLYYISVDSWADIDTLKNLLNDGYLISISINADKYKNLTNEDVWNLGNYNNITSTNHANTIVGYEDD